MQKFVFEAYLYHRSGGSILEESIRYADVIVSLEGKLGSLSGVEEVVGSKLRGTGSPLDDRENLQAMT